jgi:S-adenosylmethionine-dependent methyltransferase
LAEPRSSGAPTRPRRRSVSQTFLLELLTRQLADWIEADSTRDTFDVVDVGGGTGGIAAMLASQGHRVRVVDPSPDALASLERRSADEGLESRLSGLQGDTGELVALLGAEAVDVVICHRVLEVVDAPAAALAAMAEVLRPAGVLSLLVGQRPSVVLSQALAGHFRQARRTYADPGRFDFDQVLALVRAAGFEPLATHGIGAIADHVPEALVDADVDAYDELAALEAQVSADPAFRAVAPAVHVFARLEAAG